MSSGKQALKEGLTPKPVIVVSRCLGFDACRYDGQTVSAPFIEKMSHVVDFKTVCPEVEIGLGVPRDPIRIVIDGHKRKLIQQATGRDLSDEMNNYCERFIARLDHVHGFILKSRSPSCGIHDVKIYRGSGQAMPSGKGSGFFGAAVLSRLPDLPVEDEGRLNNFAIREHFLASVFTLARFQNVKSIGTMHALTEFHARHKLLFLAGHEAAYRRCGRIAANHETHDTDMVIRMYEKEMKQVLKKQPKTGTLINTLLHAFGGVSKSLEQAETRFFLNTVEEYRDERIPLSAVLRLLRSYAIRFNTRYLLDQEFFMPFPESLIEITDSGKGRTK
ncbi:DUF523 and DUF1722 domain-containing protein [bacterium]|nr:DUF523 and DUF1722 domain-containing protein [bacterium]